MKASRIHYHPFDGKELPAQRAKEQRDSCCCERDWQHERGRRQELKEEPEVEQRRRERTRRGRVIERSEGVRRRMCVAGSREAAAAAMDAAGEERERGDGISFFSSFHSHPTSSSLLSSCVVFFKHQQHACQSGFSCA